MRGEVPSLADPLLYGPAIRAALGGAAIARRLQSGNVRTYAAYLLRRLRSCSRSPMGCRLNARLPPACPRLPAVALAPLLPGTIQSRKARLQGRRGPSPLQPYRDATPPVGQDRRRPRSARVRSTGWRRRLSLRPARARSRSADRRALPALVSATTRSRSSACWRWRASPITAAAWDTGSGFALMGAARDLMLAVFAEALLLLALADRRAPRRRAPTSTAMSAASTGCEIWASPPTGAVRRAFALVVLVENGREPIDNPDTHLEPTMIHEGPLLEYAGRRSRGASTGRWRRATGSSSCSECELSLLHSRGVSRPQLGLLAVGVRGAVRGAGASETAQAKLRLLRVPSLLGDGAVSAIARGRASSPEARRTTAPLVSLVFALGLGVVVVRRRSVAIMLVAPQSLVLGLGPLALRRAHSHDFPVAGLILLAKVALLPVLLSP